VPVSDGGVQSLIPSQQLAAVPRTELWGGFADETIGASRKRRRVEPHPPMLLPPIPGQLHHGQDSAKRPAAEDNLLRPPTNPATGPVVQQTPIHSPCISSNLELPNTLPSISFHIIASVDIESRAREIDRNMLGRLDGKKC
jgi:hypothetical protein